MAIELTPQQKDILIRTALGEARGEGVEGMADVIQVIFNRAQSGQYPSDPAAVALQPYQFSTWNRGEGGNNPQQFKPSDPIYRKAAEALEMVASGERPDYTGGALFYHTPAVNPNWAGEVNKFGTIQRNGHIFYPSRPVPPGEIPNVVASQMDTQRPIPPLPQPRPQRMEIRPFDPARNTPRANADGSYSTEVSRTVQLPDGSWANVPSLWWGSGSTSRDFSSMSDDQLASLAQRYEKQSGQQFPRFDSLSAAEAAARARSASGAGTTGVMTAQRMVQGTGQAPTSAASRAVPTQNVTPRLAPQGDGIFAYTAPDMQPAQITPGMGSLTPDFFRPKPQVRLPELPPSNLASSRVVNTSIERANAAVDPGLQAALARRVAQPGMVETSMARAASAVDPALQRALEARNAVGVGLPPATRSVPSVPVRPAMNAIGTMPSFGQFQAQFGRPAVATQLATARPVVGFPTSVSQRPAQRAIGFPTPANIRPAMGMAQPPAPTMRVTVQGAGSYNAPQPQTFAGTSSGRSYTAGQSYTMGGDTYVANPDGSFTNTRTGRRLAGSSGGQSSQRSSSGPAQSLV